MKLREAMICLNCDEVYKPEVVEFLDQRVCLYDCPSCGSTAVTILCRWLPPMYDKEREDSPAGAEAALKGT